VEVHSGSAGGEFQGPDASDGYFQVLLGDERGCTVDFSDSVVPDSKVTWKQASVGVEKLSEAVLKSRK